MKETGRTLSLRLGMLRSNSKSFVFAAALMAVALSASLYFHGLTSRIPFIFVAITVIVISMTLGFLPCLFAAAIGLAGIHFSLHPPFWGECIFVAVSALVAALSAKRAMYEEMLRRQALIFANLKDAIIITDPQNQIVDANPIAEQMFGYSRHELIGQPISILKRSEESQKLDAQIKEAVARYGIWTGEVNFIRKNGSAGVSSSTVLAVKDAKGRIIARAGINHEITERKQLEQQLQQAQKMEAIGRLAGGIAHDFNNILTAVIGYSELLLMGTDESDPRVASLKEIEKAGHRAADLTRQLLAFSRRQMLQPKLLDLNQVVSEIEPMLRRLIGEDIELTISSDPRLGQIKADLGQMQQVIMNLAINARDAMPDGGKLNIGTRNVSSETGTAVPDFQGANYTHAELWVEDTGVGINPADMDKIFEPFFTTKDPAKGTGLGLSTVYGIVKQSDGDVKVNSRLGEGTRFEILLPLVNEAPAGNDLEIPVETSTSEAETILVIEDEPPVLALVAEILKNEGYNVLSAENGKEAIALISGYSGPLDLIVTDVVMPGLNGRETVERLSEIRPDIPVVFMSGYSDNISITRNSAGGVAFISKPFTPATLVLKVKEALNRSGSSAGELVPAAAPSQSEPLAHKI